MALILFFIHSFLMRLPIHFGAKIQTRARPQIHILLTLNWHLPFTAQAINEKKGRPSNTKCLQAAYLTIDLYKSKLVVRIISLFCLVENENRFQLCKKSKRMSATTLQWPLFKRTNIIVF